MKPRLRKQDRWLIRIVFWGGLAAIVILLASCAAVTDCRPHMRGGLFVECAFCSAPAC